MAAEEPSLLQWPAARLAWDVTDHTRGGDVGLQVPRSTALSWPLLHHESAEVAEVPEVLPRPLAHHDIPAPANSGGGMRLRLGDGSSGGAAAAAVNGGR